MAPSQDSTGLPQRQSCDRCHKQKLRCTRENTEEDGVCDRCYRRRARCVYSSSLPKGRPSLLRTAEQTTATVEPARRVSSEACTPPEVPPVSTGDDVEMTAFADTVSVDANQDIAPIMTTGSAPDMIRTTMHSDTDGLAIASMGHNRPDMESWLMPFARNDAHSTSDWNHFGPVDMEVASTSLVSFPGNSPPRTFPETQPGLHRPLTTEAPSNHGYIHSGPESMHQNSESSKHSPSESKIDVGSSGKTMVTVGQLAQLTMRLSSLRHLSSDLARSAGTTEVPRSSLVDSTAFESVAAWLARDELTGGNIDHMPTECPHVPQCAGMDCMTTTSSCGQGILDETFSASHLLLDILRNLQVEQADRQTSMILGAMMSPSPTAGHGYFDMLPGLNVGGLNGGEAMPSQARSHASIRHLVMVCNTLILEVYLAILLALQHDAYLSIHENKIMKSVRMVLIVQLCSHLIDRQCQALDLYLSSLHPPISMNESYINVDRIVLSNLKRQIQERVHQLRQMLRCAT